MTRNQHPVAAKSWTCRLVLGTILTFTGVGVALAQPPHRDDPQPEPESPHARGEFSGRKPLRHAPRDHGGPLRLFLPRPQDHGPLGDGEEEALLEFAQQHIPRMHRHLQNARRTQQNQRFDRRFHRDIVPLLRHLKRIHDADPELGELQIRHAELRVQLLRRAPAFRRDENDSLPPRLLRDMRSRIAEMLQIEKEVIQREIRALEENPDHTINLRIDELMNTEYDPAVEPPDVRELVDGYRAAENDVARFELREKLREAVSQEVDKQKRALQRHLARLSNETEAVIDERMSRMDRPRRDGNRPLRRPGRPGRG
ncbi:MAG: hypothetical protein AB7N71_04375 [Phycisphaerae bacterium]